MGIPVADWGESHRVSANIPSGGAERLKRYWTKGEGLKKWATKPHPWTALYRELVKYLPSELAKRTASQWFHDVFGIWPGERKGSNKFGPG